MYILVIQIAVSSTIYFISYNKFLYIIWVCLSYICLGGHFSVFPTACVNIFGIKIGPKIFTFLFTAIGSTGIMGFLIGKYLLSILGYGMFFTIASTLSLFSLALLIFSFDEKLHSDNTTGNQKKSIDK
jgi:hypothetical protein